MNQPKVSVLMSVFNGEKYLKESIESILKQSFSDFEFLIINDGSTDNTTNIINSYPDNRIRIINNDKNLGLIASLNKGLENVKGEYIARMDSDDISLKHRLSTQVEFMNNNPKIGASGSYYYSFHENKKHVTDFPISDPEIRAFILFGSPIPHPTSILRKSILNEYRLNYRGEFKYVEDYDLWSQMSEHCQLANLKKSLLLYRVHDHQITLNTQKTEERLRAISIIRAKHLKKIGVIPTEREVFVHNSISDGLAFSDREELILAETWLKKILESNKKNKVFNDSFLHKIIFERWLRTCFNSIKDKGKVNYFLKSDLFSIIKLSTKRKTELIEQLYYSWKRKKARRTKK